MNIRHVTLITLATWGCKDPEPPPPPPTAVVPTKHPRPLLRAKLKLKDPKGGLVYAIKPKDDGAAVVDGNERRIARINLKDKRIKLKDAEGQELGIIRHSKNKLKFERGEQLLHVLKKQKSGFVVEDGQGKRLYRAKAKPYGVKLVDGKDNVVARLKKSSGKLKITGVEGTLLFELRGFDDPLAASCLMMTDLPVALRAGFLVALVRSP